jgi:hypothetical protein
MEITRSERVQQAWGESSQRVQRFQVGNPPAGEASVGYQCPKA